MNRRDALRLMGSSVAALATANLAGGEPLSAPAPLLARRIPCSDEMLPVIGLGTWRAFDVGSSATDRAPVAEVLATFAELGGRLVDSSPMYGQAEGVVGDVMATRALRWRLFLATKVWTSGQRAGIKQMEASMEKLRANSLDLLQVHNLVDAATHLETLRAWKKQGRVRYIGVTHYTRGGHEALERLLRAEVVDFIQLNYSAAERDAEQRLLPFAQERGVAVIANRPFAGGDLFTRLREKPLPAWAEELACRSWAQLLLKFVVSHPAITCAIPATARVEHLRENMHAGTGPMPDAAQRDRIHAAVI